MVRFGPALQVAQSAGSMTNSKATHWQQARLPAGRCLYASLPIAPWSAGLLPLPLRRRGPGYSHSVDQLAPSAAVEVPSAVPPGNGAPAALRLAL